jgi:hypothetical protein
LTYASFHPNVMHAPGWVVTLTQGALNRAVWVADVAFDQGPVHLSARGASAQAR